MRAYFIFNDFISSTVGSLADKPTIQRARRRINHIEVIGRDSTLIEDMKTYENIKLKLAIVTMKKDIWTDETLINTFDGVGGELKLSWLNGSFKVKEVSEFSIRQERSSYTIELTFECEPFRYLDSQLIEITKSGTTILPEGNKDMDHTTTIYGNGDISLFINDEQIVFKDVQDHITIDTSKYICYKDNLSTMSKMVGEFIKLQPGENEIRWIGTVNKVVIEYRGRYLN